MTLDQRATLAATIAWLQWEARAYVPRHLYRRPSPDALIGQFIDREMPR
jgi:hypothetical protein